MLRKPRTDDATKELWSLDESIASAEAALELERDPAAADETRVLLGIALYVRYETAKDRPALGRAVEVLRTARRAARFDQPSTLLVLHHRGVALSGLPVQDSNRQTRCSIRQPSAVRSSSSSYQPVPSHLGPLSAAFPTSGHFP